MKAIVTLLAVGMVSCMELYPIPESQPVLPDPPRPSTPPVFTPSCPSLDKKILGSWKCTTTRLLNARGGSTNYSGRITLNADMTMLDPDSLLGYKIEDEPVTRRAYTLIGDSLILYVADRLERQVGVILALQTDHCDNPKFLTTGTGGAITVLTR
ncbi:hypothetical protein [Fibrisoma montanum]|uniref:hypothetical protein n=1 Tax=Fibrisoma montanum TaxID=2305895 RepID=UPI0013140822|nr:hypothetical protein [Fibrisoma montanum]